MARVSRARGCQRRARIEGARAQTTGVFVGAAGLFLSGRGAGTKTASWRKKLGRLAFIAGTAELLLDNCCRPSNGSSRHATGARGPLAGHGFDSGYRYYTAGSEAP